jgi:hypothetical protein
MTNGYTEYKRAELTKLIREQIKKKEMYLGAKCRKIWSAGNYKDEVFLYGWFWRNREKTLVTIAYHNAVLGWIPQK